MERTTDEVLTLGEYSEQTLGSDAFNTLYQEFKNDRFTMMLSTLPHETKKREGIYAEMNALQSFMALMAGYVSRRSEIIKSDEDASIPVEDDQDDE
jgi:hypothetical protein